MPCRPKITPVTRDARGEVEMLYLRLTSYPDPRPHTGVPKCIKFGVYKGFSWIVLS